MIFKPHPHIYSRIEKQLQMPMLILTFLYLIIFTIRITYTLNPIQEATIDIIDTFIWFAFVLEFSVLLSLSSNKQKFFKTHILDFLIVIIPVLRLLRIVTLFEFLLGVEQGASSVTETFIRVLKSDTKLGSLVLFVTRAASNIKSILVKGKTQHIVGLIIFITVFLGSLVSYFEKNNTNANITNTYEGIWWSIVSITTVGYGDRYPVTLPGRIIGTTLITLGVALFTLLTAEVSSFLVGKHEDRDKKEILDKLDSLEKKLDKLS